MSTEKSCENCLMYVDFGDAEGCALKEVPCNNLSEWMPSIQIDGSNCPTPAQLVAEELLEECKKSLNDIQKLNALAKALGVHPLTEMENSLRSVIAKAQGKQ